MKSAYQILSSRKIDSRFAANRRIYLRQKRCGHLDQRQAAEINRRAETRQIPYDPTAQRHYEIVPFEAVFAEKSDRLLQYRKRFVTLTFGHQPLERLKSGGLQRTFYVPSVKAEDPRVRDDSNSTPSWQQLSEILSNTAADIDFTASSRLFEGYFQPVHIEAG